MPLAQVIKMCSTVFTMMELQLQSEIPAHTSAFWEWFSLYETFLLWLETLQSLGEKAVLSEFSDTEIWNEEQRK